MSAQHAYAARRDFLLNIAGGEGGVDLAAAALQVAAEDDALGGWDFVPNNDSNLGGFRSQSVLRVRGLEWLDGGWSDAPMSQKGRLQGGAGLAPAEGGLGWLAVGWSVGWWVRCARESQGGSKETRWVWD